jgi:uncharacterized protein (DUF2237 family)
MSDAPVTGYYRAPYVQTTDRRYLTPDRCAEIATSYGKIGHKVAAHEACLAHIRAKEQWLLINGVWHDRIPYLA